MRERMELRIVKTQDSRELQRIIQENESKRK